MGDKEDVIKLINELPETATTEDIMRKLSIFYSYWSKREDGYDLDKICIYISHDLKNMGE